MTYKLKPMPLVVEMCPHVKAHEAPAVGLVSFSGLVDSDFGSHGTLVCRDCAVTLEFAHIQARGTLRVVK